MQEGNAEYLVLNTSWLVPLLSLFFSPSLLLLEGVVSLRTDQQQLLWQSGASGTTEEQAESAEEKGETL